MAKALLLMSQTEAISSVQIGDFTEENNVTAGMMVHDATFYSVLQMHSLSLAIVENIVGVATKTKNSN